MQVITTHLNADFDCLAAMVAAQKLYPAARMVFSGSAEQAVLDYLKAVPHPLVSIKDIKLDQVTLLVVVDTQDASRIGVFKELVGKNGVAVHVYDHHMDVANPIPADQARVRKRGSSVAILCEELTANNVALSREESTLMVLGIYEDTHLLTSIATTPEDFYAVGRLVAQGADLNRVNEFIQPRLNPEQLGVMNQLIANLEVLNFNGVDIALATADLDNYVGDLAVVVSKLMDLENLNALFALIRLDRRVYMIARSRTDEVNVAQILRAFGGGGHANAAAANTGEWTLVQVKEKLVSLLNDKVAPLDRVKHVMHSPVISAASGDTIDKTEKIMTRFNLNTLPVVSGKKLVGLITRQIVEKAIHHKLGRERCEELMNRDFIATGPEAYFKTLLPAIIEEKQKLVPVVHPENGQLMGIVSRGDLLRMLHQDMAPFVSGPYASLLETSPSPLKSVRSLVKERLPKALLTLLDTVAQVADRMEVSVYVVGGFVRDLLLRVENLDLDFVIEGDGIKFARALAKVMHGKVTSHKKFGTSVLVLPDGLKLDVASARMEFYKHPAALPTVTMSSIKSDLFRRDFTFNSLAVKLNGKDAFTLLDYFNGQRDLKDKVVRVLHNLSFIEDPTRAYRAVRFEQRYQFRLGKQTEAFIKQAVQKRFFDQLSGQRLFAELDLMLKENQPGPCLKRLKKLDLLQFVHPKILKQSGSVAVLDRVEEILSLSRIISLVENLEVGMIYFMAILYDLKPVELEQAVVRLQLTAKLKRRIKEDLDGCKRCLKTLKENRKFQPSEIYDLFSPLSSEAVLLLMAVSKSETINKQVLLYFTQYHGSADFSLTGDDLIGMGIAPGPVYKTVFKTLRDARLNGRVRSREEEVALVHKQFLQS